MSHIIGAVVGAIIFSFSNVLILTTRHSQAYPTTTNITLTLPNGTTNHGDPHLLCTPTKWTDIALFFLGNFVAHAGTVRKKAGEPFLSALLARATALLIPSSGVMRGLLGIWQHAKFGTSPLIAASKAGALCMVVRTAEWKHLDGVVVRGIYSPQKPTLGESVPITYNVAVKSSLNFTPPDKKFDASSHFMPSDNKFDISSRKVHGNLGKGGKCPLPLGYALTILPPSTAVAEPDRGDPKDPSHSTRYGTQIGFSPDSINSSYSFTQGLIAAIQTIYAFITLYLSRGDQLQHYGYAAFGLTVIPYLLMSVVNLLSTILTPDYDEVYLVYSEIMGEAVGRGGTFNGVVGCIADLFPLDEETIDATFTGDDDNIIMQLVARERAGGSIQDEQTTETNTTLETSAPLETKTPEKTNTPSIRSQQQVLVPSYPRIPFSFMKKVWQSFGIFSGSIFIGAIALVIIGSLTGFHPRGSTRAQRTWTMTWLASGIYFGLMDSFARTLIKQGPLSNPIIQRFVGVLSNYGSSDSGRVNRVPSGGKMLGFVYHLAVFINMMLLGIPAIGGFVVVGQMLRAYGNCTTLD
jgi:hypothetical protein